MIKILKYGEIENKDIFARVEATVNVEAIVADIIANVRKKGDSALYEYCEKFDKAKLDSLEVTKEEIDEAVALVEPKFLEVLERAAKNIRNFHEKQLRNSFIINNENGIVCGQKIIPIDKVGLYVPGGTAAYPSTVLMDSIPAKIAGCREIVMVSPPGKDGKINPVILAAAKIAGVDKIFKLGGAQAVAALAYGTESVPKVDKIVGPGNAFVAEAKRQVFGLVNIDRIFTQSVYIRKEDIYKSLIECANRAAKLLNRTVKVKRTHSAHKEHIIESVNDSRNSSDNRNASRILCLGEASACKLLEMLGYCLSKTPLKAWTVIRRKIIQKLLLNRLYALACMALILFSSVRSGTIE